jgi:hypothetical protein
MKITNRKPKDGWVVHNDHGTQDGFPGDFNGALPVNSLIHPLACPSAPPRSRCCEDTLDVVGTDLRIYVLHVRAQILSLVGLSK